MNWLARFIYTLRRAWLRMVIWGLDMDLAILEERARRVANDRADFTRRRSELIIDLINLEAEGSL